MNKDPLIFIKHIQESINWVEKYTEGLSKDEFFNNIQVQDAVIRRLEIIGEAVKNLPENFKRKSSDIPWEKIAGLRNILIHEYFGIDIKLLWNLLEKDLPNLKNQINKLL